MLTSTNEQRILVAGATGYIGRHVVQALAERGHEVLALTRHTYARPDEHVVAQALRQTKTINFETLDQAGAVDTVVSCLASRTGVAEDAWRVDHGLNQRVLDAALKLGAQRFVLLSAICVQKPRLAFQFAKREFEKSVASSGLEYAIVRPTAYFKSLAGQIERVQSGKPFLLFGDGELTACRPISASDLAAFMVHHVEAREPANAILPIGGPGPALTLRDCGQMLFDLSGKPAAFRQVSPALFRVAHALLRPLGLVSRRLRAKAELARIGHYYATESMLVWDDAAGSYSADATPSFGHDTLRDFYAHALEHGLAGHALGDQRVFSSSNAER